MTRMKKKVKLVSKSKFSYKSQKKVNLVNKSNKKVNFVNNCKTKVQYCSNWKKNIKINKQIDCKTNIINKRKKKQKKKINKKKKRIIEFNFDITQTTYNDLLLYIYMHNKHHNKHSKTPSTCNCIFKLKLANNTKYIDLHTFIK